MCGFVAGVVKMEWCGACVVPMYNGKGNKCVCSSLFSICLLCMVGKLHDDRMLSEKKWFPTFRSLQGLEWKESCQAEE